MGGGADRPVLPAGGASVRGDTQDARDAGRRGGTRPGLAAAAARGQLRAGARRRAGCRAADRGPGLRQRARASAQHVPPVRRVQHRLQLRRQEQPGPQLPLRRPAPRRGPPYLSRGTGHPPAAGQRLRGRLPQARPAGRRWRIRRRAAFARQLTTFRTQGPHPVASLERFGRFFAGQLWDVYGPRRSRASAQGPTPGDAGAIIPVTAHAGRDQLPG
jgi:hypothetical protein